MNDRQFMRLEALIVKSNRWTAAKDCLLFFVLLGLFAWNVNCEVGRTNDRAAAAKRERVMLERMDAMIAMSVELRRIIAMQREDPKAFPKVDAQMKAVEQYERARIRSNGLR